MELLEIQKKLRKRLKESRFEHTLGVRYTAAALAMRHQCDVKHAEMAGLLHDCAKRFSNEELFALAEEYKLEISDAERQMPHLLHAKVGAYLAKTEYGVTDEEIIQAITYHTTGKPDMSVLEKIVFLADYIEPNRKMLPGLPECRRLAFEDLDLAMYQVLNNTLEYLKTKSDPVDPTTREAFEYYASIKDEKNS